MQTEKKKLIILSDLWGSKDVGWVYHYVLILKDRYEIIFYDVRDLANVDTSSEDQEAIHNEFVNGGIDRAVERLRLEEIFNISFLIGFSIGGTIGWKYALQTGFVLTLLCVSSTRLRYEKVKPKCTIDLYFGNKDIYAPENNWFEELEINKILL